MSRFQRAIILVADGVGCGGAPDAAEYGDAGADTLGNLSRAVGGLALPNLGALGLGHLTDVAGVPPHPTPSATRMMARWKRGVEPDMRGGTPLAYSPQALPGSGSSA